jgi:predicted membrane protein
VIVLKRKAYLGILFILFGISMLLQQLGLWDSGDLISTWWPMILIAIGLTKLTSKSGSKTSGVILTLIGLFFQMKELNLITVSIAEIFWPVIIIAIGISILIPRKTFNSDYKVFSKEINDEVIDKFSLFSAIKARNISGNFRGGSLVTIFGGIDLDLRDSIISKDGAKLEVTAVFGGMNIIVPSEWRVVVKGVPIFGGCSNKTHSNNSANENAPVLVINYFAAFGGLDVRNS